MNKKFTKLMAALALLTFLAVPMGMWGQSRESITASYGWEDADDASQWTISSAIVKTSGQGNTGTYAGKINTNTTTVQYNDKVNVTSFSYALKRTSTNNNYSVYIQTSTDGQTWNTVDTHAMSSFGNGTYTTVTKTFDGNTAYYVRFYCNNTTATRYVDDVTIVYNTTASTSFTVNYDCNGGETDCPENVSGIAPGTSITLASAPSRQHYNFIGWSYGVTTYNPGDPYTVNSNVTFVAQWEPDGTYGEGSICFSNQSSCTAINSQSVTGEDDLGNTWTITTVGTNSFTSNSGYYQVGSGNSPATSITFTTTLDEEVNVTDFSAMFGGFSATRASVVLKVDDTQVGSGTLNGAADVTVSSSSAQIGTTLTVIVTPTAGGVKCYNISYAYETIDNPAVATTTIINVPQDFNTDIYQGTAAGTLTATVSAEGTPISGATVTWSSSNTGVATIDANGEVTLVAVGTTTITASYAGIEDQYRPSTGTYELTVTDSNAPGTQNNPYTVAQAIAATPSNGNVYIQGIVSSFYSTSIVDDGSNYRYYISDDGTTTTELLVYRGTGLNQAPFTNADDLLVGDEVVICGTLTMYNNAPEINSGNYLYSWNRPVSTEPSVTVTPNTINAPFAGAQDALTLTYENIENFISFDFYFCDAEGNELQEAPNWITALIQEEDETYSLDYDIDANVGAARTAYMKVYTFDDNLEEVYAIVTVSQAQYVVDYAELPFEWEGGASEDLLELNGVTAYNLGDDYGTNHDPYNIKLDNTDDYIQVKCNQQPGKVTIGVKMVGGGNSSTITVQGSADGDTFTNVEELTISGTQNDVLTLETSNPFASTDRYVRLLFTKGSNVGVGPITIAVVSNEAYITVNPDEVEALAQPIAGEEWIEGTLNITYANLEISGMTDFAVQFYDAESEEISAPAWIEALVAEQDPSEGEGYVVSYIVDENDGAARTAYFKVFALGDEDYVYSNLVTVSQAAPVAPATGDEYALYTGELVEGDYLIVYDGGAMNTTVESDRLQYEDVTVNNDVIVTDNAAIVWHIAPSGQYWTIYNADAEAYAASTGAKNKAQMLADGTDDKAFWTVSGTETYEFVNKQNAANEVNANLRKNGTYGFACYATSTGGALSLYKKVEPTPATYTKDIVGNTWYFIASPTGSAPSNVDALSDLYYYDEQNHYWRNKKVTANAASLFNFDYGKGYLCANGDNEDIPATVTLSFTGDLLSSNTRAVDVYYHTTTQEGQPNGDNGALAGWNLVGNPFNGNATLNADCFILNGSSINTTAQTAGYVIAPFAGVMVKASATGTVLFTKVSENAVVPQPNQVQIEVGQKVMSRSGASTSVHDNAIINFNEGSQLEKFIFNPDAAKLYIPQDNKEFAIVSAEAQGEMPVCFKAIKDGEYTITVSPEGVELNYLHLIDNMTGMDVDLLQTPSYTFDATTRDYESRFKLVFDGASTSSATDESFAYYNGSEWQVSNEGAATLQVVDVMGRILKSESINGNFNLNLNQRAGVYMLRLINGDNVKVQKVVVR